MDKPTKPTNLMPRTFGGIKNNFSQSLQQTGYEPNIPAIYGGDNLNYQLNATGEELDYLEKIVDFINATPIGKVVTVDENNKLVYDDLNDIEIATKENLGIVQIGDGIDVDENGIISSDAANKDLSNLTNLGNSRLQYAPFSINAGTVTNGENNTLRSSDEGQIVEVQWIQPVNPSGITSYNWNNVANSFDKDSNTYSSPLLAHSSYIEWDFGETLKLSEISATGTFVNFGATFTNLELYKVDNDNNLTLIATTTGASASSNYTTSATFTPVECNKIRIYSTINPTHSGDYPRIREIQITATHEVVISAGDTILCDACTITTCDGRTKVFDIASSLNISTMADGDYWILKNYNDGTLSLIKQNLLKISKKFALHGTTAGSITVDRNGVCSGFSTSNYIYTPTITLTGGATWKLTFEVTTPSTISNQYFVGGYGLSNSYDAIAMGVVSGKFYVYLSNSTSSNLGTITGTSDVQTDTTYEGYIEFTGTAYNLYINGELEGTLSSSTSIFASKWQFGGGHAGSGGALSSPWLGTLNMNKVGLIRSGQNYWTGKEGYLDNSVFPYQLYVLQDDWTKPLVNNNDLVCIGSCTLTSGAVTSLYNFAFDATKSGEWVQKATQLSTATTVGVRTISLADYLPKDIFNYELMMRYWITRQDTSNLDNYYYLTANDLRYLMTHVDGGNSNADNKVTGGQCSLLEWGARAFIEEIQGTDNHALKSNSLYVLAYKRVGT